jgi:hypothetical protein
MDQDNKDVGTTKIGENDNLGGTASPYETAGDKPPTLGAGSGMGGGSATSGRGGNGHGRREARALAEEGIEATRGMADRLFGDVRNAAEEMIEERKGRAAETVHGVAEALRRTASNLKDDNDLVARYAQQAAETIDRFSETVRQRRVADIVADLDDFARRQPTLFLVGAVAAGFIVGRFMAASAERHHGASWHEEGTGRGHRAGAAAGSFTQTRGSA